MLPSSFACTCRQQLIVTSELNLDPRPREKPIDCLLASHVQAAELEGFEHDASKSGRCPLPDCAPSRLPRQTRS